MILAVTAFAGRSSFLYSIGNFSGANFFGVMGQGPQAGTNTSFAFLWHQNAMPTHPNYPFGWVDDTHGWFLGIDNTSGYVSLGMRGHAVFPTVLTLSTANLGWHCLAWGIDATNWRWSVDGGPVVLTARGAGSYSPAIGSTLFEIGRIYYGDAYNGDSLDIAGLSVWGSLLTDTQLRALSVASRKTAMLDASITASAAFLVEARDFIPGAPTMTSRGSSPITFAANGNVVRTRRTAWKGIKFVTADFADNGYAVPRTGLDGLAYERHNAMARIPSIVTNAPLMSVEMAGVGAGGSYAAIEVQVNGAHQALVTANGVDTTQSYDVVLPAGDKTVTLIEPGQTNPTAPAVDVHCGMVVSVAVPPTNTLTIVPPSAVEHRLVTLGNSITTGGNASNLARYGWVALVRANYPTSGTGGITNESWGFRSLLEDWLAGGNSMVPLAIHLAALCDGTISNTILDLLGTNDYAWAPAAQSAANFRARKASLFTEIRARTNARIIVIGPIARVAPASETANSFGDTLGDYRTADSDAVIDANIPDCEYHDGSGFVRATNYNADGVHLTDAGHAELAVNVQLTLGRTAFTVADFTSATTAAALTYARTGVDIWLATSSGTVATKLVAGAGVPWQDTGVGLGTGVLVAPAFTNIFAVPYNFSDGQWVNLNSCAITTGQTAPDGTTDAVKLRDTSASLLAAMYRTSSVTIPGTLAVWVADVAGDVPSPLGAIVGDQNGVAHEAFGGAAYRRVRIRTNPDGIALAGQGAAIYTLAPAGGATGFDVSAVGSVLAWGSSYYPNTVDYPLANGASGMIAARLSTAAAAEIVLGGNLTLSGRFTPLWTNMYANGLPGYAFSASTPDGLLALRYDHASDTWILTVRGADVLTAVTSASVAPTVTPTAGFAEGQEIQWTVWYHPTAGTMGIRLSINGNQSTDATGVASGSPLAAPTAAWVGSNVGTSGSLAAHLRGRVVSSLTVPAFAPEGIALGASVMASYVQRVPTPSFWYTAAEAWTRAGILTLALPGDTIAGQSARWSASAYKATVAFVVLDVGLNDLSPVQNNSAPQIAATQALIDTVRADNPTCKIILCTMTPGKQRFIDVYGATAGGYAYANWLAVNLAITNGTITGADAVVSSHTAALNDGVGNLAAAYDTGDHIHFTDPGRAIFGAAQRAGITATGALP
jgi:lysophospholipase L1-like esterase